jgi:hypothetical protein
VTIAHRADRGVAPQARRPGVGGAAIVAIATSLALAGCAATSGSAGAGDHTTGDPGAGSSKYGSLPSFLPHESFDTDRVLIGSAARPALTTEGDTVSVGGGSGAALITVTGPEVPGEGLPYQAEATTCTWTVTIHTSSLALNLSTADFSAIDHLGTIYQPSLVPGQPSPPSSVAPHTTVTFELRAVMVVGEGLMLWSPDGKHPVAKWDFEVEND